MENWKEISCQPSYWHISSSDYLGPTPLVIPFKKKNKIIRNVYSAMNEMHQSDRSYLIAK